MPRNTLTDEQVKLAEKVIEWVHVYHKETGNLPSYVDAYKSSLLGRIVEGKAPLDFPPPTAYSYPAYAFVENTEPQVVDYGDWKNAYFDERNEKEVVIYQASYEIMEVLGEKNFIIRSNRYGRAETPYRWRLWYDAAHKVPATRYDPTTREAIQFEYEGAWLMQIQG